MEPIKCFFLEPTGVEKMGLRRYGSDSDCMTKCPTGWHDATTDIGRCSVEEAPQLQRVYADERRDDPRWPKTCEKCGYEFKPTDAYQLFTQQVYRRVDTGEELTLREAPAGAMYYADWMIDRWDGWDKSKSLPWGPGPDGHFLVVKCPPAGREWNVDSRASNCDLKEDNEHKCWVRHGSIAVPNPDITVDKNGLTCNAGAGSIIINNSSGGMVWHGHLKNGYLVEC